MNLLQRGPVSAKAMQLRPNRKKFVTSTNRAIALIEWILTIFCPVARRELRCVDSASFPSMIQRNAAVRREARSWRRSDDPPRERFVV